MSLLVDLGYFAAGVAAAPVIALKSLRTGKYRSGWAGRFGFGPDILPQRTAGTRVLLLHCVSVGELLSVNTLVQRLLAADPRLHIVITTTTDTGTERARKLYPAAPLSRIHTTRFPLDFSFAVEQLFDRIRPDAVALVELETWPNFLAIAESRRIPVVLINGRLSERSFPRYRLIRPLMAWMLRHLRWIAVQNETIARRFRALGAPPNRTDILPTLKYDNAEIAATVAGQDGLARAMGLAPSHQLWVAGSTGPGEEETILNTYDVLRRQFPLLRLAIAPRHDHVVPQVIAAIRARSLTPILRSERPDASDSSKSEAPPPLQSHEVFVLNTLGELRKLYALAFGVFVGRSLIKRGGGGSDMIEVAALAKPCCFGPFTGNFAEAVELLTHHEAAVDISNEETLVDTVAGWLHDPAAAAATGKRAQELIGRQQGSTDRYVAHLLDVIHRRN